MREHVAIRMPSRSAFHAFSSRATFFSRRDDRLVEVISAKQRRKEEKKSERKKRKEKLEMKRREKWKERERERRMAVIHVHTGWTSSPVESSLGIS